MSSGPAMERDQDDWGSAGESQPTLTQHLREQLMISQMGERDRALAHMIVDSLDEDGYFKVSFDELAALVPPEHDVRAEDFMAALRMVQSLDPAGVAARTLEVMDKTGANWIATTDYRTSSMLRWELKDRLPVVQINERCRYMDFRPPDLARIEGHRGLWVAAGSRRTTEAWDDTTAVREYVESADRVWRGHVFESYDFETISNWTPELSPPPSSPLFKCSII